MSKKTLMVLAILALAAIPALAGQPAAKQTPQFPASDVYTIHSRPSFNVTVGDRVEVVTCKAELRLRTGKPYVASDGMRRVDLEILDWKADGYSELLGGDLHFRMEQGMPMRDPSFVKSYQAWNPEKPLDFPAHAQFAMPYQLETPFGKINGLYGLTSGSITSFPPQHNAIFTMKKGDTAEIVAALLPESISSLSAAGEVTPVNVTVRPSACMDGVEDSSGATTKSGSSTK
ncbi:MAG TPA: hypothetical protein VMW27_14590 [Thermoanaerobaculia bacterium]|nr:hypothetical protein [Thermoanaerobaculia bacterium]